MSLSSRTGDRLLHAAQSSVGGGRLGVYAALGAMAGSVPLPWIPDSIARRVRGALVHDVAARHGLSLSAAARDVLASPDMSAPSGTRGLVKQAARYLGVKLLARVSPVGLLPPVRRALSVFVLGYLFDRYIVLARSERAVRIDEDEARRVRAAIDKALVHAITADGGTEEFAGAPEELRDSITQVVDTVIMTAAALPGWLTRRLDAAFDELIPPKSP